MAGPKNLPTTIFSLMAGPKNLPCDMIEPVNADGSRYLLEMAQAASFARHFQLSDAKNFPRAMDPSEQRYHFCNHWQGKYNVRFIEKVNKQTGELLESVLIWGQPKHSMREFYNTLCIRWPELSAVGVESTFCRFLVGKRKIAGFRVTNARDLPNHETDRRLPRIALPVLTAAPRGIVPVAACPAVTSACSAAQGHAPVCVPTRQGHIRQSRLPAPSTVQLSAFPVVTRLSASACDFAEPTAAVCTTAVAATPVRSDVASARTTTISASPATGQRMSTCMSMRGDNFAAASHALGASFAGQLATPQLGTSTCSAVTTPTAQAARDHSSEELDSPGAPTLPRPPDSCT